VVHTSKSAFAIFKCTKMTIHDKDVLCAMNRGFTKAVNENLNCVSAHLDEFWTSSNLGQPTPKSTNLPKRAGLRSTSVDSGMSTYSKTPHQNRV
jgi:hypothetical protein